MVQDVAFCEDQNLTWSLQQGYGKLRELNLIDCSIVVGISTKWTLKGNHPTPYPASGIRHLQYDRRWSDVFEKVRSSSIKQFTFGETAQQNGRTKVLICLPFSRYLVYKYGSMLPYPAGG